MDHYLIKNILIEIGQRIARQVHDALKKQSLDHLSSVFREGNDDLVFQIDRDVENLLLPALREVAGELGGIVLVAEGLSDEGFQVLPESMKPGEAQIKLIIDPIDGTRGIMYDKRSAFFLAAAAPNLENATLGDLEVAVMVEIPTSRLFLSDTIWAVKGQEKGAITLNLVNNEQQQRPIRPSTASRLYGGFGQIARFFPPGRDILAAMDERLIQKLYPDAPEGHTIVFEDQYISSGGQLYELLTGHDRFVADLRTLLFRKFKQEGKKIGHQCHPYDLCAHLIGEAYGLIITGTRGEPLIAPLDTTTAVDWIAYANQDIRDEIEPKLQEVIKEFQLY